MINNWNGNQEAGSDRPFRHFRHRLAALVVLLIIALTSLGVIGSDLYSVGVSQVGILVNPYTGDFSGPVAGPTLAWKSVPWINVVIVSTSVQTIQMVGPGNNINVLTRDNLNVSLDVTVPSNGLQCHSSLQALSRPIMGGQHTRTYRQVQR